MTTPQPSWLERMIAAVLDLPGGLEALVACCTLVWFFGVAAFIGGAIWLSMRIFLP
jgi:hypothetical protein